MVKYNTFSYTFSIVSSILMGKHGIRIGDAMEILKKRKILLR